jgi:NTP pyrophosphatase (non-canonical NTP hydrolase)
MGRIRELQVQHVNWLSHNFPEQQDHQPLLGIVEEVGELAHALLKSEQGIRGGNHRAEELDAIGDIFIYMLSYCNTRGIDLEDVIEGTWRAVRERDWVADPAGGGATS